MANPFNEQTPTWRYVKQHTFGSFLKRLRVTKRLSRHSLAGLSGIQERRLETLELSKEPPCHRDIKGLAKVLETPEGDLLEAAGYLNRKRSETGAG